ncbi:MAG: hypothetical protein JSU82_17315 [Rhodospirillales bacterium]|nr:MAG: hypothetical protein JSU82_17315 [Rhodospirillales bacterium]
MTQTLARTLQDIAGDIFDAAAATPVGIETIQVRLPMEFGLKRHDGQIVIAMQPPDATQARELTPPTGRFSFRIDIARGGGDG